VSDLLFSRNPNGTPGLFTQMRAQIVNKKTLANVGRALNIAPFIQLGKGEEHSGGRKRDALIADCVEALLAAIYVDMGWESVFQFVEQHFLEIIKSVEASANQMDYRSQLQHYCQFQKMDLPEFRIVKEEGPDHDKMFEIEVYLGKEKFGLGRGTSKKAAEQEAARQTLSIKGVAQP
jgi:ribonuclease III